MATLLRGEALHGKKGSKHHPSNQQQPLVLAEKQDMPTALCYGISCNVLKQLAGCPEVGFEQTPIACAAARLNIMATKYYKDGEI